MMHRRAFVAGMAAVMAAPSLAEAQQGARLATVGLNGKRLEILLQAIPTARRIAVLNNPGLASTASALQETRARANALGVELLLFEATAAGQFSDVMAEMARRRPDAFLQISDPMFTRYSSQLVEAVSRHRLPAMWEWRDFVESGGLMSYGPSYDDIVRRAATYVDRVLKGAKPGDLPVEQATKFGAGHQPQDDQGPRPHHSAVAAAAGGSGH